MNTPFIGCLPSQSHSLPLPGCCFLKSPSKDMYLPCLGPASGGASAKTAVGEPQLRLLVAQSEQRCRLTCEEPPGMISFPW